MKETLYGGETTAYTSAKQQAFAVCDGKEQIQFERWAKDRKMDMTEHPLHWLFLHPETNAARQAWKAALEYAQKCLNKTI